MYAGCYDVLRIPVCLNGPHCKTCDQSFVARMFGIIRLNTYHHCTSVVLMYLYLNDYVNIINVLSMYYVGC